jgi:peptidoglycan/LPS O-acetylase OafA/YrhL
MQHCDVRFYWLDGLRGVAACYVLSFHFFIGTNNFASSGWIAVDFFFVLSGFVLCNSITFAGVSGRCGSKAFIKKRIIRIYPLLIIALLVKLVLKIGDYLLECATRNVGTSSAIQYHDIIFFALSFLLLQFLYPLSSTLLVPLWSISTEFYSNLLQLILGLTGSFRKVFLCMLLGVIFIIVSGVFFDLNLDWSKSNTWLFGFGRALVGFNLGQIVWMLYQRNLGLRRSYLILISIIGFTLSVNVWFFAKQFILFPIYLFFGFLVMTFAKFKNPDEISKILFLLKVLGKTSYPIYLFHTIILDYYKTIFSALNVMNYVIFYLLNLFLSIIAIKIYEPKVKICLNRIVRG